MHSKNSDCILSAFQIFGPILVTGPKVFIMLKTFEVHSKWKNIERHSNCTRTALLIFLRAVTAFQQHSKHSDRLRRRIEKASHFKFCQNVPNAPRMSRNAFRLLPESISILQEFSWNAIQMSSESFDCHSNAARIQSERPDWPSNESGRNSEHRRIAYLGKYQ